MKRILTDGSKWPLVEISKEEQQKDVLDALTFGNHKGASAKLDLLWKLISKDVKYRYSFAIPLSSVTVIPRICMALMNIIAQNTIDNKGQIVLKDRLTHNQSWHWSSGTSINSQVQKDFFLECRYGFLHPSSHQLGGGSKEKAS
jgi:hypothetical protein